MLKIKDRIAWSARTKTVKRLISRAEGMRVSSELELMEMQRRSFNIVWKDAVDNLPFYKMWMEQHNLPCSINCISDLQGWPILKKPFLVQSQEMLVRKNAALSRKSVTGGATGEPLHFRTFPSQVLDVSVNKWLGWQSAGFDPDDRCFLIWGHRHFYGSGMGSDLRFALQRFKDWLVNNRRASAIDLSSTHLARMIDELITYRPKVIIAYSASLLAACRHNLHRRDEVQRLGVSSVVCTAGPLTMSERTEIGQYFGANVSMEYGSMEAGVIAYMTDQERGYRVFRDTHIVHTHRNPIGNHHCLVTTLTHNYLPLIRYDIGDYVHDPRESCGSVEGFSEVSGRDSDQVVLDDGTAFHGYAFMVCAESIPNILAYQLHVQSSAIEFRVRTRVPLSGQERIEMNKKIIDLVPRLASINLTILNTDDLLTAPSGKIPLVIYGAGLGSQEVLTNSSVQSRPSNNPMPNS